MGKLVRDKIPDIIRTSGRTPRVTTLSAGAYRAGLRDKLREEVDELLAAESTDAILEETADVLEVLTAIAADRGHSLEDIVDVARRKHSEKGGFERRLRLDGVDE